MSELKRDYWSESLVCVTGIVKIDRREIAAIVISPVKKRIVGANPPSPVEECNNLDIHLKSGTIFTATEWDVNTIANLYLVESPVEGVKTVPYVNIEKQRQDLINKNLNITDTPCICGKNTYNGTLPKTFNVSICGVCDGWF